MSQMAPERPAPQGGGNVLTRKVGPLPTWAWLAIVVAGGVGFIWWRNHQQSGSAADQAAAAADAAGSAADTGATDDAASVSTLQSEIQQLQGEESTEPADVDKTTSGGGGGVTRPVQRTRTIVVEQRQTLAQLARRRGWPARRLKAAEALNGLSAGSELRRGQKIKLPA